MGQIAGVSGKGYSQFERPASWLRATHERRLNRNGCSMAAHCDDDELHEGGGVMVALSGICLQAGKKITARDIADQYRRDGTLDTSRFDGHFAIGLYDDVADRLLLCRDAIGITPLYYAASPTELFFASECKLLLMQHGIDRSLDAGAMQRFLDDGWTPAHRTFFQSIRPVPPGYLLVREASGTIRMHRQTPWEASHEAVAASPRDITRALEESVAALFGAKTDQRVGIMLSGGIDSALIGGTLRQRLPEAQIHSFTVGYGEDDPEIIGARATAAALNFTHHDVFVSPGDLDRLLPAAILAMETLGGHDEYPCLFAAHEAAAGKVDILFSGNMSDTLFAGMDSHRAIWRDCYPIGGRHGTGTGGRILSAALQKALLARDERLSAQERFAQRFDMKALMPFTASRLITLALSIPDDQKLDESRNKIILRQAAAQILPREIAERPKGIQQLRYDSAMIEWLVGRLGAIQRERPGPIGAVLNADCIGDAIHELSVSAARPAVHRAWNLCALDAWYRAFAHELPVRPEAVGAVQ
ncbi:asparagine synthetase B family protein [Nitratireductor thuwali]|uniref:asparagine synthase (glutamine-hydrolyzing) n=1 Tax=Nitratireductor thuwali TaxID=2267699 RepID=A0ABY5MSS2_9HYPH|nr:Asparagine synthetase [glutamine-hydrolyzing] 1 [Nitratireductor thuwali]